MKRQSFEVNIMGERWRIMCLYCRDAIEAPYDFVAFNWLVTHECKP